MKVKNVHRPPCWWAHDCICKCHNGIRHVRNHPDTPTCSLFPPCVQQHLERMTDGARVFREFSRCHTEAFRAEEQSAPHGGCWILCDVLRALGTASECFVRLRVLHHLHVRLVTHDDAGEGVRVLDRFCETIQPRAWRFVPQLGDPLRCAFVLASGSRGDEGNDGERSLQ